ncbi:MAG: DKNYY domain-containing protein [Candidatus Absconditabacterales bacterium]
MENINKKNEINSVGNKLKLILPIIALFILLNTKAQNINDDLPKNFYFDKKGNCFFDGKKIQGLDKNSLIIINEKFFKDKNYVYGYGEKLDSVCSDSFEIINNFYFKDEYNVYHYSISNNRLIKNSRESGKIFGPKIYFKKIDIDPKKYKIYKFNRIKDGNIEYFDGEKIEKQTDLKKDFDIKSTKVNKQSKGTIYNQR